MKFLICTLILFQLASEAYAQDVFYTFFSRGEMSVSQSELKDAVTLKDIHPGYHADWVDSYISTEITVTENGSAISATNASDTLNIEQKIMLENAPVGSQITILVRYLPHNTLKHNTEKTMDYSYKVMPSVFAEFIGGEESLNTYVDNNIIAKLDSTQKEILAREKVEFTVSTDGSITEVIMPMSSGNSELDKLLLQSFCDMPKWKPAEISDGTHIKQKMEFFIGNSYTNCVPWDTSL